MRNKKKQRKSLEENFIGSVICKTKPNTFKLLKHMNEILKNQHVQTLVQEKKYFYNIVRNYGLITLFKKILGIQEMLMTKL
jgi:hypothetical protein